MIQIVPSSLDIGWAPPATSMIDKPAMPERRGAFTVEAVAVGPAVGEGCRHALEDRAIGRLSGPIHESDDAAHENSQGEGRMDLGTSSRRRIDGIQTLNSRVPVPLTKEKIEVTTATARATRRLTLTPPT